MRPYHLMFAVFCLGLPVLSAPAVHGQDEKEAQPAAKVEQPDENKPAEKGPAENIPPQDQAEAGKKAEPNDAEPIHGEQGHERGRHEKGGHEKADQQPAVKQDHKPRRRLPLYLTLPNPNAQKTPASVQGKQRNFFPEASKQPPAKQLAEQQPPHQRQQPNPPFVSPRQQGLSRAATYRLESLGNHVHLSPAMRWHLNRADRTPNSPLTSRPPEASRPPEGSTVVGQGAQQFYPGVSRLPKQKPFSDVERPPSGLQSYWPLLLEGRQDPNTGLIIWALP